MTGRKWRRNAFTLIELLVVIAVIALLASLLLPSLRRAKWYALRAACLSNLHQIYIGAGLYLGDHDGALPFTGYPPELPYWGWCNSNSGGDVMMKTWAWLPGRPTGLYTFYTLGYTPVTLLRCPAARWPRNKYGNGDGVWPNDGWPNDWGQFPDNAHTSYDYRYNTQDTVHYWWNSDKTHTGYDKSTFSNGQRAEWVLFNDAAEYRVTAGIPNPVWSYWGYRPWMHTEGGNVMTHSGRGLWLRNSIDVFPTSSTVTDSSRVDALIGAASR